MIASARLTLLSLLCASLTGLMSLALGGAGQPETADLAVADSSTAARDPLATDHGSWRWPLEEPITVAKPFDLPKEPWLAGHRGIDLKTAADGSVFAPADGQISYVGWIVDRNVVVIDHGGLRSTLEPVETQLTVGCRVSKGELIGQISTQGAAHCDLCLHWGVRRGQDYLDPALLVDPRPRAILLR
jgi:murein DD-endopeptidase MepM/ murein hydrolase activator NlpD